MRGLRLEVDAAPRLGRLLLALSMAYILAILLGSGEIATRIPAHIVGVLDRREQRRLDRGSRGVGAVHEFRSGAIYRYFAVPEPVVEGLIAAESKGAYFNRNVRNRFRYQRMC